MQATPQCASSVASPWRLVRAGSGFSFLALCFFAFSASAQTPAAHQAESLSQLIPAMIYNELNDRGCDSYWEYRSERVAGAQDVVREQVETADGPIFRVLEDHGTPLDAAARRREDQRLRELLGRPGAMAKVKQDHEQDEERMRKIIEMMPSAYLYGLEGEPAGDLVRISFRPNPAFIPSGYEARIVHALTGTVIIDQRLKRLVSMNGRLVNRVDFGYGLLGHIEKDGTFEIRRQQVSDTHWKTSLVEVHLQGKLLLFKSVTRDQRETRSDFHPVPHEISLAMAAELLDQAPGASNRAALTSAVH